MKCLNREFNICLFHLTVVNHGYISADVHFNVDINTVQEMSISSFRQLEMLETPRLLHVNWYLRNCKNN